MSEIQIAEIWNDVNQILELNMGRFSIKLLQTRKWYLQVLQTIYPFLNDKLIKILQIQAEDTAIDRMLILLTQQQIIQDDFLQIKGKDLVDGDIDSIFYVVQLLNALVQRALQEAQQAQEGQQTQQKTIQQKQSPQNIGSYQQLVPSQQQKSNPPLKNILKITVPDVSKNRSDQNIQRQCHSVQAIGNQFEQDEQEQSEQDHHLYRQLQNKQKAVNNIFSQAKKQNNSPTNLKNSSIKNQEEQQFDENYLKQRLQKHKSQQRFKNVQNKIHKKPKRTKKQVLKIKKLVAHPPIIKKYAKATTAQQKKLSQTVKKTVIDVKKNSQKLKQNVAVSKLIGSQIINKKKRQLTNYLQQTRKLLKSNAKDKTVNLKIKNDEKLKKLLKWKQENLRRQKKELEMDMEAKVQLKKQLYVKKINQLIIALQKNRVIELKREENERQRREKEMAYRRLEAIEQQYKTQMKLIHQKSQDKLKKRGAIHTDHRAIIQGLEKQLKRQNDKQILDLKMKFRRQQAQLQDDLQKLQSEIIKTYKRN